MRNLHTMLRVKNLDDSIAFYCGQLGMELRRRTDYPGGEFTLAFVGYPGEPYEIELTWNWDSRDYEVGTGFGHLAVGVPDIRSVCDALRTAGIVITREPGPMKHGTTVIAFVRDPNGYSIELIERPNLPGNS